MIPDPDDDCDLEDPTPIDDSDSDLDIIAPRNVVQTPSSNAFCKPFLEAMKDGPISVNISLDLNIIRFAKLLFAQEAKRRGCGWGDWRVPLKELEASDALPISFKMSGTEFVATMDRRDAMMEAGQ